MAYTAARCFYMSGTCYQSTAKMTSNLGRMYLGEDSRLTLQREAAHLPLVVRTEKITYKLVIIVNDSYTQT